MQPQDPDVGVLRLKEATHVLQAPVVAAQAVQFAAQLEQVLLAVKNCEDVQPHEF